MSLPMPILLLVALVCICVAVVYLYGLSKRWGVLIPFIGMLLFGSLALPVDWNDQIRQTLWLPIQTRRSMFYLVCGLAALPFVLLNFNRLRGKRIAISALLLVAVSLYGALLRFFHVGAQDGTLSVGLSVITLLPLLFTAMIYIEEIDDLRILMRAVVVANVIWVGMSFVQFVANPMLVTTGNDNRFIGVLSNPQHSGVLLAFFFIISLWLMLNERGKFAFLMLCVVCVNGILLLWTGSRTGLGMMAIGLCAILYSRAGKAILLLPVVVVLGYVVLTILVDMFGVSLLGFQRLTSTEDTRTGAWIKLINAGTENPLFGAGTDGAEKSENSWLYGFASYGIVMLALLIAMTFVAAIEILKSIRARFWLPGYYRNYLDFLNGIMLMYFAGAVLEGYMVSRVSPTICIFMIVSVANATLRKIASEQYRENHLYADDYGDEYEYPAQYGDADGDDGPVLTTG